VPAKLDFIHQAVAQQVRPGIEEVTEL